MPHDTTEYELSRRRLVNLATQALTEAVGRVTEEHGELYATEWLMAFQTLGSRVLAHELAEIWSNPSPG